MDHYDFLALVDYRRLHETDIYMGGRRDASSLMHLLADWDAGQIRLPPHQRELSWSDLKQQDYVKTICSDSCPPGGIELYQLYVAETGRLSLSYLNDGCQRLHTARDFLLNPEKYGLRLEEVEYVLRTTAYPVTYKVHRSHTEALHRYQDVNSGLPLTPYQYVVGSLIYCEGDGYREGWQQFVEKLHEVLYNVLVSTGVRPYRSRDSRSYVRFKHRDYRHDLSLFLRFISGEKTEMDYHVAHKLSEREMDAGSYFEHDLATTYLGRMGLDRAIEKLEEFKRVLEIETATIVAEWADVADKERNAIGVPILRWLYDVAIWRRNLGARTSVWKAFLASYLRKFHGTTALYYVNEAGETKRINVGLSRVNNMSTICRAIDFDYSQFGVRREREAGSLPKVGFQHSHIDPFETHGNGPTIIEPASVNMARGAEPIEETAD